MKGAKRKRIIRTSLTVLFFSIPFLMWFAWYLGPKRPMNVFVLDKTVLTKKGNEHRSFYWLLTNDKIVKPNNEFYSISEDYFGFFPLENKKYKIKDLSGLSEEQIDSLAKFYDLFYFTDTYGVYYNEWYTEDDHTEHSRKIYGGLDKNDFLLLEKAKEYNKLILTEFNFFASPTSDRLRKKVEESFKIKWSGWVARYFDSLDTLENKELPKWVKNLYLDKHNHQWPFTKSGIVFVNKDKRLFILENNTHMDYEVPVIQPTPYGREKHFLPKEVNYPFWIDWTYPTDTSNKVVANFKLITNSLGDSILNHYNVPHTFPAVIEHTGDYKFYYFSGDFCDNPVKNNLAKFRGINFFIMLILTEREENNREPFFWKFYIPLMKVILEDYYQEISTQKS